jgi:hypothetical protein
MCRTNSISQDEWYSDDILRCSSFTAWSSLNDYLIGKVNNLSGSQAFVIPTHESSLMLTSELNFTALVMYAMGNATYLAKLEVHFAHLSGIDLLDWPSQLRYIKLNMSFAMQICSST